MSKLETKDKTRSIDWDAVMFTFSFAMIMLFMLFICYKTFQMYTMPFAWDVKK